MKKNLFLIVICICLLLAVSCELSVEPYSTKTLRIVGYACDFSKIQSVSTLMNLTLNDVEETMYQLTVLGKKAGYENIELFLVEGDHESTRPALIAKMKEMATYWYYSNIPSGDEFKEVCRISREKATEDDLTIFLISTHGVENIDKDNEYDGSYADSYMLENYGFALCHNEDLQGLSNQMFLNYLDTVPGEKLVISAACFSGSLILGDNVTVNDKIYEESPVSILFSDSEVNCGKNIHILACAPYFSEGVAAQNNHTFFFEALLKGLGYADGAYVEKTAIENNMLTLENLAEYIINNGGTYDGKISGRTINQFPVYNGGSADFVIFNF